MPQLSNIVTAGTTGEITPRLQGRIDLSKYYSAFRTLKNFYMYPHGPITFREGSYFVCEAKNRDKKCKLIPFKFSITQNYMLEFGYQYIRVYMNGGAVAEDAESIEGATQASQCVITITGHPYANGDELYIDSVVGMTELNGNRYRVSDKAADTFKIKDLAGSYVDSSGFGEYTSGGSAYRIYEISTPYEEADLFALQRSQSADIMYITYGDIPVYKLSRTGHTSWTMAAVEWCDGPYLPEETGGLTPSATSGSITLTSDYDLFVEGDVNRLIRLLCEGSVYRWVKVTAVTDSKHATVTVMGDSLPSSNKVTHYRMGYWSEGNGYPFACTFHEQRLLLGGCPAYPNTIWGSGAGSDSFEDFTPGTTDADPFTFTLVADQVNAIRWLSSGLMLLAGCEDAEWVIKSNSLNEPITPSNITADSESNKGSAPVAPVRIDRSVFYAQYARRKLFEYDYKYTDRGDSYVSTDRTLLAEHITKSGIVDMAYQAEPNSIIWCVLDNGKLVGLTYQKEHDVIGWHQHETDGEVESVAVIPTTTHDQVWIVVKRTVDGVARRYIEYFNPGAYDDDITDAFFVDCGLTYDGEATDSISGLDHLEGEEVAVLADGAVHNNCTVENGAITLDWEAEKIHIGLPYTGVAEYLGPALGGQGQTIQGKKKRLTNLVLRLLYTLGGKVGPDEDHLDELEYEWETVGEATPLFTDDKEITPPTGYELKGQFCIVQDKPLPMTVVAVMPKYEIGEE